jgi:DNA end-binding protein Ku
MAQRPIWEGHLRLSLVACPVSLFTAAITFHLLNPEAGHGVRSRTVDSETGAVDRKALVRHDEFEKHRHQALIDEVRLDGTGTIGIERWAAGAPIEATRATGQRVAVQ